MIINEGRPGKKLPTLTNPGVAGDLLSGKQLIGQDGNIITGTIPSKASTDISVSGRTITVPAGYYPSQASKSIASATQATPSITVSSGGLITASATQSAGYVTSGTKSATKQLTTQAGKTVTPGTSQQTAVASGRYTTGTVYVAGDTDLKAANIKKGVNIFGVAGTYEGEAPKYWVGRSSSLTSRFNPSSGTFVELKFPGLQITEVIAMAVDFFCYQANESGVILISPGLFEDGFGPDPYCTGKGALQGANFSFTNLNVNVVNSTISISGFSSQADFFTGSNTSARPLFGAWVVYK